MSTERSVTIRLRANTAEFTAAMKKAGADTAKFGRDINKELAGEQTRANLTSLGNTAGKIGLVAAAGFGAAVVAAANFDQAISNVAATGQDAVVNLDALRQAAIQAGADTKFSASEAAAGIENLAKAGVSAGDILDGGLTGALNLAAAGELDVASAAEFTATALTQFQLAGSAATHVADLLAAGAGKAQGEVTDMALALKYVGVPAANLGVSIEEAAGSIALLAKNGILGEMAGTSLRGMLSSLTSPSAMAAEQMKALGIEVFDTQGKFIGFQGVAGQLQNRMKKLTDQERANALGRIFGNEQLQAANVLYREGAKGVREWTRNVNDEGYAAMAASTRMNNLKGDFEQLTGSLETLLITTGEGSQGALRQFTQALTGTVNAANQLPAPLKQGIASFGLIVAIVGGGVFAFSRMAVGIAATRVELDLLAASGKRTAGVLAFLGKSTPWLLGLSAAAAIIISLKDAFEDAEPSANELLGQLLDINEGNLALEGTDFSGLRDEFDDTAKAAVDTGKRLGDAFSSPFAAGAVLQNRELTNSWKDLDTALQTALQTGGIGAAENMLEGFGRYMGWSAEKIDMARDKLPGYSKAVKDAGDVAEITGTQVYKMGKDIDGATVFAADLATAFKEMTGPFLNRRAAGRAIRETARDITAAIKDAKKENDGSLKGVFAFGTESGDEFQAYLDEQAQNWQAFIDAIAKTGDESGTKKAIKDARADLIALADQFGLGKEAARKYVNEVMPIGKKQVNQMFDTPGLDKATTKVREFRDLLYGIDRSKVNVTFTAGPAPSRAPNAQTQGLKVYAEGGYTGPGTKFQPAGVVHAGEFVFSAAATQGNVAYLSGLHQSLKGYATGGFVAASRPAPAMSTATDMSSVLAAAQRPLYGDVYVQPHDYNEFVRQQRQDLARASSGGLRR